MYFYFYFLFSIFYFLFSIFYFLFSIFYFLFSIFYFLFSIFYFLFSIFYFLFSIFYLYFLFSILYFILCFYFIFVVGDGDYDKTTFFCPQTNVFFFPLLFSFTFRSQEKQFITEDEMKTIFSSVEVILGFSSHLLQRLRERYEVGGRGDMGRRRERKGSLFM